MDEKNDHDPLAMNIKRNTIQSDTLEREINWFADVVNHRFTAYFNPEVPASDIDLLPPPDLDGDLSNYARIVKAKTLGYKERLAIMLASVPHLKPNLLDIFFTKNAHFDRSFTEFGGIHGKQHTGFLPTGETLHFLLHAGDVGGRSETWEMLSRKSVLVSEDIIRLERSEPIEPLLSGALVVGAEFLNSIQNERRLLSLDDDIFPAKRITTELNWDDLIVDAEVSSELVLIRQWIENEEQLMKCSTFRKHIKPGFRALFYGPPGTGKTLTASLLGKATGMDVYRIDLSMTVSKYIGETEKNLARIFDYAEKRNWILFFDEADALFGKRTQTNSSNDRYANQEVSYLLQRIEDFPGTVILASNLKSNIDEAFVRRFQSMVYFPMPTKEQRLQLWAKFFTGVFTAGADVDFNSISEKYELSGGAAINVFRYCSLRAATRKSKTVTSEDILHGVRREFQKVGKTIQ
jgi:AAA+ superfamily predicted ATPase